MRSVDPAIIEALGLDPAATTKLTSHGGSGFSSTFKLTATVDGREKHYFVKTGRGEDAAVMFKGEHESLNAIDGAVPNFCPRSYAHGACAGDKGTYFLVTDFLDLTSKSSSSSHNDKSETLAQKLARLHTAPVSSRNGNGNGNRSMYGFPVRTCCGATVQDNAWKESWAEFFADNRLRAVLRSGIRKHGNDSEELSEAVERTAATVVPRLLGNLEDVITPVLVHGDLWSGNHGRGRILNREEGEEGAGGEGEVGVVVFDPSCVYAHSEYELGIMRMFGGFGTAFWKEYETLVPKTEPREEYEDRLALYELYHHLNHWALFGGMYKSGAMSIMRKLWSKYGRET
ncbi:fructosamine kinase [Xylariaceae sp. FL0594]|nr:fructosamine kinase [Xylariaceae sp. FL0594]